MKAPPCTQISSLIVIGWQRSTTITFEDKRPNLYLDSKCFQRKGSHRGILQIVQFHKISLAASSNLDIEHPPALVDQVSGGAPHVDGVADGETLQVLSHLAALGELGVGVGGVDLHHEVHVAEVLVTGGGGVGPHHEAAVDPGGEVNVLADGQAEAVLGGGQGKPGRLKVDQVTSDH